MSKQRKNKSVPFIAEKPTGAAARAQDTYAVRTFSKFPNTYNYNAGFSSTVDGGEGSDQFARRRNAPGRAGANGNDPSNAYTNNDFPSDYNPQAGNLAGSQADKEFNYSAGKRPGGEGETNNEQAGKKYSSQDAENPVVEENAKRRNDILDIRQRLRKCFRCVHAVMILSGICIIIAGCLIARIDSQIIGNLELNVNDFPNKMYLGTGCALIFIAIIGQLIVSVHKFKILTWLIYLLNLCVAVSTCATCSFTSLRSYKNHHVARNKLFELMTLYNGKRGSATEKWDLLHQGYECCGVDNFMDWTYYPYGRTSLRTPMSCCRNFKTEKDLYCGQNLLPTTDFEEANKIIFAKGCIETMMNTADVWYLSSGLCSGLIVTFLILHFLFCFFLITSHRL